MSYNSYTDRKYRYSFNPILSGFIFCFVSAITVFSFVGTARAGLISFIFGGEQASAKISSPKNGGNLQTVPVLVAATNIDPNPDKPVETIPVVGGETLDADLAGSNFISDASTEISSYVVRPGDTITGVAKMFNVSINTVLWANDLTSKSILKAGQTLVILPVTGIGYTVQKNDTVSGIAKKYKADAEDIYDYNDLTPSSPLAVGQKLIIPDAELPMNSFASQNPVPTNGAKCISTYERWLEGWNWPAFPGYYIRPIVGGTKSQCLHGHNAVDFADLSGTPIRASAAGKVIIAKMNGGWNGGYGNFVVILHQNGKSGTQTLYAHASRVLVSAGQDVEQGQTIALMGSTGQSTGSHVHFEIRGAKNPF